MIKLFLKVQMDVNAYDYYFIVKYLNNRGPFFVLIDHDMLYTIDDFDKNCVHVLRPAIPLEQVNEQLSDYLKDCLLTAFVLQLGYLPKPTQKKLNFLFVENNKTK